MLRRRVFAVIAAAVDKDARRLIGRRDIERLAEALDRVDPVALLVAVEAGS